MVGTPEDVVLLLNASHGWVTIVGWPWKHHVIQLLRITKREVRGVLAVLIAQSGRVGEQTLLRKTTRRWLPVRHSSNIVVGSTLNEMRRRSLCSHGMESRVVTALLLRVIWLLLVAIGRLGSHSQVVHIWRQLRLWSVNVIAKGRVRGFRGHRFAVLVLRPLLLLLQLTIHNFRVTSLLQST